jgi:NADPH2:quinone reductase
VQLAKWGGAKVIATVSSAAKAEQARKGGADLVINYKTEDVAEKILAFDKHGVDRVVDVDFGGNWPVTQKALARFSTVAIYASRGNAEPQISVRTLTSKNVTIYGMQLPSTPMPLQRKAQQGMQEWMAASRRIHNVSAQFPLKQTADAHLAVEAGTKRGTVIVDCAK